MAVNGARKRKRELLNIANRRGVHAVRRRLDPVSFEVIEDATNILSEQVDSDGNVTKTFNVSVTVIGFSRFTPRLINEGPPTKEVISGVPSRNETIAATVGRLGLFGAIGPRERPKLAYELHSEELNEEISKIEEAYRRLRFPLVSDAHSPDGRVVPHCSLGFLLRDAVLKYEVDDGQKLRELESQVGLTDEVIHLRPVVLPNRPIAS